MQQAYERLVRAAWDMAETKGEAKGRAEGEAEGEDNGKAKALIALMRQRFKSVPRQVAKRVVQASSDELSMWLERVLTAKSPEAAGAKSC